MVELARTLSRISGTDADVESLKAVVAFACVGLLISLLFIIYGLDVIPWCSKRSSNKNPPRGSRRVEVQLWCMRHR
jgi:hypothetical protein